MPGFAESLEWSRAGDDLRPFWAYDFAEKAYYRTGGRLTHASNVVSIWVEDGLTITDEQIRALAEAFETQIQPRLRQAFGPRATGGDATGAITVFLLDVRDAAFHGDAARTAVSGYFDPANEYSQADLERTGSLAKSNAKPMFYVDLLPPSERDELLLKQSMAHEYAHLIRWHNDQSEDTWLDEGTSELAVYLAGLGIPRAHVLDFVADPEATLTDWHEGSRDYGKVFLFMLYLHEQFAAGDLAWWQPLIRDPADGLASVRNRMPPDRPLESVFRDWAVALFLDDVTAADGRYGFRALDLDADGSRTDLPHTSIHDFAELPVEPVTATVPAWSLRGQRFWTTQPTEFELEASQPLCALAVWSADPAPGRPQRRWDPRCVAEGATTAWTARVPATGARWPTHLIVANTTDNTSEITLRAADAAASKHDGFSIYLPVIRRK